MSTVSRVVRYTGMPAAADAVSLSLKVRVRDRVRVRVRAWANPHPNPDPNPNPNPYPYPNPKQVGGRAVDRALHLPPAPRVRRVRRAGPRDDDAAAG